MKGLGIDENGAIDIYSIHQLVEAEDYNTFPVSENEILDYLLQFRVNFDENGAILPKNILHIIKKQFNSFLDSKITVLATDLEGRERILTFDSTYYPAIEKTDKNFHNVRISWSNGCPEHELMKFYKHG